MKYTNIVLVLTNSPFMSFGIASLPFFKAHSLSLGSLLEQALMYAAATNNKPFKVVD